MRAISHRKRRANRYTRHKYSSSISSEVVHNRGSGSRDIKSHLRSLQDSAAPTKSKRRLRPARPSPAPSAERHAPIGRALRDPPADWPTDKSTQVGIKRCGANGSVALRQRSGEVRALALRSTTSQHTHTHTCKYNTDKQVNEQNKRTKFKTNEKKVLN